MHAQSFSHVQLFDAPWTATHQLLISQARILEWVAISFSRESSPPKSLVFPALAGGRILLGDFKIMEVKFPS